MTTSTTSPNTISPNPTDTTAPRSTTPIRKILVANRGEIARRVFRTCRDLGIATVAVYSDDDAQSLFVLEADESVPLGGSTPAESYLGGDLVIEAALRTGADAIHPGYGFLSENPDFARACAEAGIAFIGPGVRAIELMGSKLAARELMENAGVPVLPGKDLTGVPEADIPGIADAIGWPVLVKASHGGGGRGMRVVRDPDELLEAIASARREAGAAFGNDTVFLEHYVDDPRHVEIQIFGDTHGTVVHLNERECSIQRRHQKILEESPSVALDADLRARMGEAAVLAGAALDYVGAGTVEFLLGPDGRFFFLEVNTRLQVEHPVTELVTGLDLVRLQVEVAEGAPLPAALASGAPLRGHAVEARLYAEDPANGFLPQAGTLHTFEIPGLPGIRVDTGVAAGDLISPHYDPMIAKVIASGENRAEATARLAQALRRSRIHGIATNRALLVAILEEEAYGRGEISTHYLEQHTPEALLGSVPEERIRLAALTAALAAAHASRAQARALATIPSGFRSNPSLPQSRSYATADGREIEVEYSFGRSPLFRVDGEPVDARLLAVTDVAGNEAVVDLLVDGVRRRIRTTVRPATQTLKPEPGRVVVDLPEESVLLTEVPRFPDPSAHVRAGSLTAPMPGTVVRVETEIGAQVTKGDVLLVMEAMKMEHAIRASADGTVVDLPVSVGTAVDNGQLLIVVEDPADAAAEGQETAS
ncbi:biotin carboxylase N-terminal domain-containing protein [Brevibacterium samyangense]|uniref:Biotin carboxylase N-terminal domain-containing protein n=1 Tax=Brevibacterium samyangense TaxID=366888 RepID=A0ABN2T2L9_9MICO